MACTLIMFATNSVLQKKVATVHFFFPCITLINTAYPSNRAKYIC